MSAMNLSDMSDFPALPSFPINDLLRYASSVCNDNDTDEVRHVADKMLKVMRADIEKALSEQGLEGSALAGKMAQVFGYIDRRMIRYGLVYEDRPEKVADELVNRYAVMHEDFALTITNAGGASSASSADGSVVPATANALIEGDNLVTLTALRDSGAKFDMIYIDPPYNTGNKDFIYNDKYIASDDAWRHSDWISFMLPRLRLARDLLADDGIIFISIDDNEESNLRSICDTYVFGESCFIRKIVQLRGNAQNDAQGIQCNHEYILAYGKTPNARQRLHEDTASEKQVPVARDKWNLGHKYAAYRTDATKNGATGNHNTLMDRKNLGYTLYWQEVRADTEQAREVTRIATNRGWATYESVDGTKILSVIGTADYDATKLSSTSAISDIYTDDAELIAAGYSMLRPPVRKGGMLGCWTWSLAKYHDEWNNGNIIFNGTSSMWRIGVSPDDIELSKSGRECLIVRSYQPMRSVIDIPNSTGTSDLHDVVPSAVFSYPKSVRLISKLIRCMDDGSHALHVLDFFAGSGTTGQAVLEANRDDGGTRTFVLATNNENGICENVTYPRLRNVIQGYRKGGKPDGEEVPGIPATLRYLRAEVMPRGTDAFSTESALMSSSVIPCGFAVGDLSVPVQDTKVPSVWHIGRTADVCIDAEMETDPDDVISVTQAPFMFLPEWMEDYIGDYAEQLKGRTVRYLPRAAFGANAAI